MRVEFADGALAGGEVLVRKVANGFLEDIVSEVGSALGSPAQASSGTRRPRTPAARVILINLDGVEASIVGAARTTIEGELDAVAAGSSDQRVQTGFAVDVRTSLAPDAIRALGKLDVPVYLFNTIPYDETLLTLLRRHLPNLQQRDEQPTLERLRAQFEREGGAEVELGGKHVCFVSAAAAQNTFKAVRSGQMAAARRQAEQRVGELALHEIGHALGVDPHASSGLMKEALSSEIRPGQALLAGVHFAPGSAATIRSTIESRGQGKY